MGRIRHALQSMGVPVDFEPDNVSCEHAERLSPRIALRWRNQLIMDMSITRATELSEALGRAGDPIAAETIAQCIAAANDQRPFSSALIS